MRTERYNGLWLEMYDSIDELPIHRFMAHNKYVLIDSGVGGDIEALTKHLDLIRRYNANEDKESVDKQALNAIQNIYFIFQNISPKMNAFVVLLKSINGKAVNDLTQEGINRVIKRLGCAGLTWGKMNQILDEIKKNWIRKSKSFFQRLRDRLKRTNTTRSY